MDSRLSDALFWFSTSVAGKAFLYPVLWLWGPFAWIGLPLRGWPLLALTIAAYWIWWTLARNAFFLIGRAFGFAAPEHAAICFRFWLPWRAVYLRSWLAVSWWWEEQTKISEYASARIAGFWETTANLYDRPSKIFLGRSRPFGLPGLIPVGIEGRKGRHLCMVAGTGSGKSVQVATQISLHEGGFLVIDPKGQFAKTLRNGLANDQRRVCVLDPSYIVGGPQSAWNPFGELECARKRATASGRDPDDATVEFAQKLVSAIILTRPGSDPFWTGAGKDLCLSVVLWMDKNLPRAECTLAKFYELVTVGLPQEVTDPNTQTGFTMLLWKLSEDPSYDGIIASGVAGVLDAGERVMGSVLITIRETFRWMKRPGLRRISERSDFHLEELHSGALGVFVCSKISDIREEFPGWFRLLVVLTMAVFEDINKAPARPALMVLEEFASLSRIDSIEVAVAYMRSFGLRLLIIIQEIGQLRAVGYSNWETFIGNAECCWWMATNNTENLSYIERRLGKASMKEQLDGPPSWWIFSNRPRRHTQREREVMTADQIGRLLARGNMLVTRDLRAFILKPEPYFKALPVWRYQPDPAHKERFLRAFTRRLLERPVRSKLEPAPATGNSGAALQ